MTEITAELRKRTETILSLEKRMEAEVNAIIRTSKERSSKTSQEIEQIVACIKNEHAKLEEKRKNADVELKNIQAEIDQKKQQYNMSIQENDETKTKEIETELIKLEETERALSLRINAFAEISGCDNEKTENLFRKLYSYYVSEKETAGERSHTISDIKKKLDGIADNIKVFNKNLDQCDSTYKEYHIIHPAKIVHAYEMIYGKIIQPKGRSYSDLDKLDIINKVMTGEKGNE